MGRLTPGEKPPAPTLEEQREATLSELRVEHPNWVEARRRMGRAAAQYVWNPGTKEMDWKSADRELNFMWHGTEHKMNRLLESLVTLDTVLQPEIPQQATAEQLAPSSLETA